MSCISFRNRFSSRMDSDVISYIFLSHTVTARASFFRRMPLHSRQGVMRMKDSYSCFMVSEKVSRYLRSTLRTSPSKATG